MLELSHICLHHVSNMICPFHALCSFTGRNTLPPHKHISNLHHELSMIHKVTIEMGVLLEICCVAMRFLWDKSRMTHPMVFTSSEDSPEIFVWHQQRSKTKSADKSGNIGRDRGHCYLQMALSPVKGDYTTQRCARKHTSRVGSTDNLPLQSYKWGGIITANISCFPQFWFLFFKFCTN